MCNSVIAQIWTQILLICTQIASLFVTVQSIITQVNANTAAIASMGSLNGMGSYITCEFTGFSPNSSTDNRITGLTVGSLSPNNAFAMSSNYFSYLGGTGLPNSVDVDIIIRFTTSTLCSQTDRILVQIVGGSVGVGSALASDYVQFVDFSTGTGPAWVIMKRFRINVQVGNLYYVSLKSNASSPLAFTYLGSISFISMGYSAFANNQLVFKDQKTKEVCTIPSKTQCTSCDFHFIPKE